MSWEGLPTHIEESDMDGTSFPEAVQMMQSQAYHKGYDAAKQDTLPDLVSLLLFTLREELERHPYEAPGLHHAIDILKRRSEHDKAWWQEYLDEEDFDLLYYVNAKPEEFY